MDVGWKKKSVRKNGCENVRSSGWGWGQIKRLSCLVEPCSVLRPFQLFLSSSSIHECTDYTCLHTRERTHSHSIQPLKGINESFFVFSVKEHSTMCYRAFSIAYCPVMQWQVFLDMNKKNLTAALVWRSSSFCEEIKLCTCTSLKHVLNVVCVWTFEGMKKFAVFESLFTGSSSLFGRCKLINANRLQSQRLRRREIKEKNGLKPTRKLLLHCRVDKLRLNNHVKKGSWLWDLVQPCFGCGSVMAASVYSGLCARQVAVKG